MLNLLVFHTAAKFVLKGMKAACQYRFTVTRKKYSFSY